jgi:hypothetical protein
VPRTEDPLAQSAICQKESGQVSELTEKLAEKIRSKYWTSRSKQAGDYFQGLRCPECSQAEAWAYARSPFSINCNRKNECGTRSATLGLFPELLEDVEKDNPPTSDDPHKPARTFLQHRGLSKSLDGLRFEYRRNIRKTGSGGVMFYVGENGTGPVWNGRLFNPPRGEGKTHNQGSTAGMFWRHPAFTYDIPQERVFVTEGIIDALSLIEMGHQAIAVLSSGADPSKLDFGDISTDNLTIAFDADSAGAGGLRKWKECYPEAAAIVPISGDWNDLLTSRSLEDAKQFFDERQDEFTVRAQLLLAEDAYQYADIFHEFYERAPGLFVFNRCYWHSYLKKKNSGDVELITSRASNFTVKVSHFQRDNTEADRPVFSYNVRIIPQRHGRIVQCTFSGNELGSSDSLTKILLTRGKALWEGDRKASLALARKIVEAEAPEVRLLQTIGRDPETDVFVFQHFAIDQSGQFIELDRKGFFRVSGREYLRAGPYATIKPAAGISAAHIYNLLCRAWPDKAAVAIAWMVAGWFVHLIKSEIGFFPFLTFNGDTQTGKTNLAKALNRMQCFDEEGLPMAKVNTSKGEIRKIAQRSSLFKALLEGNKTDEKVKFDYDAILTLYNENPLQVRAQTTNDIQTRDVPFRSSILFVQNTDPFRTRAQKERLISLRFIREEMTPEAATAFNELQRIPPAQMAHFFVEVMRHREAIQAAWFGQFNQAKEALRETVKDPRITENHALILAFHNVLVERLGIEHDLQPFIEQIALKKVQECAHRSETLADHFFTALNGLTGNLAETAVDKFQEVSGNRLFLILPEAVRQLRNQNYDVGRTAELQTALKEHPAFLESNKAHRGYFGGQVREVHRVWVFNTEMV